jgi:hypothetical protein
MMVYGNQEHTFVIKNIMKDTDEQALEEIYREGPYGS